LTPDQNLETKGLMQESAITLATMPTISNKKSKKENQENTESKNIKKVSYYFFREKM
jgi:hypothetical protein